jgi:RNA polymerase sigma factor (sigma-70 family)
MSFAFVSPNRIRALRSRTTRTWKIRPWLSRQGAAVRWGSEIALQKKSRNALLRQSLKNLSPDHREIIDLVYYHEKSVDDAAQIIGIPSATVKTRMFYARKKLAEQVQEA